MSISKAIAAAVVLEVCEGDPADPEHPDTVTITTGDLETIVRDRVAEALGARAPAPVGLMTKERLVRALYESSPYTINSPALAYAFDLPMGAVVDMETAKRKGATFAALEREADAILGLFPSFCLPPASDLERDLVATLQRLIATGFYGHHFNENSGFAELLEWCGPIAGAVAEIVNQRTMQNN